MITIANTLLSGRGPSKYDVTEIFESEGSFLFGLGH